MANEKRLIDANALMDAFRSYMVERYDKEKCISEENCKTCEKSCLWRKIVSIAPTVDAVEVVRIEKVKQEILQGFDVLIAEYRHISQSSNDYFGIKADAMDIARRLVDAALTDLCDNCSAKMDGERKEEE